MHTSHPIAEPSAPRHGTTVSAPFHHVNYGRAYLLLAALAIVTIGLGFMPMQRPLVKLLAILLLAFCQAIVVAYYFMHLKFEGKMIYAIFIIPMLLGVLLGTALIPDILFHAPDVEAGSAGPAPAPGTPPQE